MLKDIIIFFSKKQNNSDKWIILIYNKEYELLQYHNTNFNFIVNETQSFYSTLTLLEINLTWMDLKT